MSLIVRTVARHAASLGVLALLATPAVAQTVRPEHKGSPICFSQIDHSSVPGLSGYPTWPAAQNIAPLNQVRGDTSDPRWSNAPIKSFLADGIESHYGDFRTLFDPATNELVVAIQVYDDPSDANLQDFVHFGIANNVASPTAYGVTIPVYGVASASSVTCTRNEECQSNVCSPLVTGAPARLCANTERGRYVLPDTTAIYRYSYASGAWGNEPAQGLPPNGWIKNIAIWNDPGKQGDNGAAWVVQFRVVLSLVGLAPGDTALLNMGANVAEDSGNFAAIIPHVIPNTVSGCTDTADGSCANPDPKAGPFIVAPSQWHVTQAINSNCPDGITIEPEQIATRYNDDQSNRVRTNAGESNTFRIAPSYHGIPVDNSTLRARIRIANWGTVADPQAGWYELLGGTNPSFLNSASVYSETDIPATAMEGEGFFDYNCNNTAIPATNVCGLTLNTAVHQCIQVVLSPARNTNVPISRAVAWKNTRFVPASEVIETAQISVQGLQAALGNSNARDVYLHVKTVNMPMAGTETMNLDVDALESLRDQVDPFFESGNYCSHATDLCIPSETEMGGQCLYEAPDSNCGDDTRIVTPSEDLFCLRSEECVPIPDGGANPLVTSQTRSQVLTKHYPTMMVYPYYDSGRTRVVRGVTRHILKPMVPFGLHITHEGEFYGWLHGLSGTGLEVIRPDWYHIRINNEAKVNIEVRASAEEQPHHDSFSEISGTATILGFNLGFVNITGTADATKTIDLTKATITMTKLLAEGNTERVTNLKGPRTLSRNSGATSVSANFQSSGGNASVRMSIIDLPILGRIITINTTGANVTQPASCGWFGTTTLTTQFTLSDGVHTPVTVKGEDQWTCVPLTLLNY